MPASPEHILRLKAMVGDPLLTDLAASKAIERYPIADSNGEFPFLGTPPDENPSWLDSYDLHAASADILEEKASELVKDFDFATETQRFERSQKYNQMMSLARWHRSRRALGSVQLMVWPSQNQSEAA